MGEILVSSLLKELADSPGDIQFGEVKAWRSIIQRTVQDQASVAELLRSPSKDVAGLRSKAT